MADLFPKFSLTGSHGLQSISASDWFSGGSRFWSIGPTISWPIFDAGRIRANIEIRNAQQQQALTQYEKTVLAAFSEVEKSLVNYSREQVRRQALVDAVASIAAPWKWRTSFTSAVSAIFSTCSKRTGRSSPRKVNRRKAKRRWRRTSLRSTRRLAVAGRNEYAPENAIRRTFTFRHACCANAQTAARVPKTCPSQK